MPSACVVPIFRVMDQTMHTGRKWKTASPISHKKLFTPAQNWDSSTSVFVPPSNSAISPIMLRKPSIRPPTIIAGISGANISAKLVISRWSPLWFCFAASFTTSLDVPSTPDTATKSL